MTTLLFMGLEHEKEVVRPRVYGGADRTDQQLRAFMHALATTGVLDCPAYDQWIERLDAREWLNSAMEPRPQGDGRHRRWRLNAAGLAALAEMGVS